MAMFWVGLIAGLVIGGFIGMLIAALCNVAAQADEESDRLLGHIRGYHKREGGAG